MQIATENDVTTYIMQDGLYLLFLDPPPPPPHTLSDFAHFHLCTNPVRNRSITMENSKYYYYRFTTWNGTNH